MTSLMAGGNCVLPGEDFEVRVRWVSAKASLSEVDVSAFVLGNTGKVASDSDMVFYGQTTDSSGAVHLKETNRAGSAGAREALLDIDLRKLRGESEKVAITSTLMDAQAKGVSFKDLQSLVISIYHGGSEQISFDVPVAGKSEAALIVGEFYKRNGQWKFRAVGQGFNGGLKPLAEGFGVSIEAEPKSPPPPPAPAPSPATPPPPPTAPVNLSKITLTKAQPKISLAKQGGAFGEIKINLNWNKRTASKGLLAGIFGGGGGIDLDLRCLFELKDGSKGAVQALGRVFGDFDRAPFIRLMGDDRTGANNDGEWMRINGARWDDIKRIIVFTSIYEGVTNWGETDGVVTVFVPGNAPIEVKLDEGASNSRNCAIVLLENIGGEISVKREVQYFASEPDIDQRFGWGLRWSAGSK
ncbi:TerD family protein [Stenotrophomonas forensis]|uniref:TerD family protein n=1 Tax=Stenotrophomonas forensis TaxID=2871169 RepID=UPI0036D448FA